MAEVEAGEKDEEEEEREGEGEGNMETQESIIQEDMEVTNEGDSLRQSGSERREGQECEGSKSHTPGSVIRAGIGTLLNIDESSDLQHGTLRIRPPINIGCLLDPLDEEKKGEKQILGVSLSEDVSFESFVAFASALCYSSVAVETAKQIYAVVDGAGSKGVSMETLKTRITEQQREGRDLVNILQDLINFDLVSYEI